MIENHFTLERIGEIVGKNPATIRTHINRGYVVGQGPRKSSSDKDKGKHERFSANSLMEIALAYRIEASGIGVKEAFAYAAEFAHTGAMDFTAAGQGKEVRRLPGLPYHLKHGHTYMGMMAGRSAEISGTGNPDLNSLFYHLRTVSQSRTSEPMLVIDVTEVFAEVCAKLPLDYRSVLDAAYPEEAKG
ncbi:hypothetical protein [Paracoccus aestuariivivens]|uniref:HTH merR-type domain-containing protein n=1 Tax=Paracoccus aestuariivivens TaxID=1820333 RepID=A0A6L6J645_9RHOB|nr:hypothetical protein [Paracoccus aestuariivivens]MTH77572.1 hypothetical protein [Paracoccus aestuariivivens]